MTGRRRRRPCKSGGVIAVVRVWAYRFAGMSRAEDSTGAGRLTGMGLGIGIFLIAVGGLLAFAVDYQLGWLDINVAGWVLLVVGVLALLLTLLYWSRRRSTIS